MEIKINVKPHSDFEAQEQIFTSFDQAIDFLKEWRAAIESTTTMDDAFALMKF